VLARCSRVIHHNVGCSPFTFSILGVMRDAYHDQLEALTESLVRLTGLVAGAVGRATQALIDADLELAQQVISHDAAIDRMCAAIEEDAFDLLARQQPVASDLRAIVTSLRIVADLERAGDYATHIAEVARRRHPSSAVPLQLTSTILEMGQMVQRIVTKAGSVVASRDLRLAAETERDDDVIDALHQRLFGVLLDDAWDGGVEPAIDVILCSRYYERAADHAVSVARRVTYLITGERIVEPA
jgi:phosphate transport system protein